MKTEDNLMGNIEEQELRNLNLTNITSTNRKATTSSDKVSDDNEMDELTKSKKNLLIGEGKPVGVFKLYYALSDRLDIFFMIIATLGSMGSGVAMPLFAILFGGAISNLGNLNGQSLLVILATMRNQFYYVGTGMLVANLLSMGVWMMVGMRQIHKMKEEYFKIILKQEQGWFDSNNAFEFATKVQAQIKQIEGGVGDKMGNVIMNASMFVTGLIIAFITSWKLTLVLFTLVPLMGVGMYIITKAVQEGSKNARKSYEKAGGIAEEILYSIKTVASFANFSFEIERYNSFVMNARKIGTANGLKSGFGLGFLFFVIYCTYALAIGYGSQLIANKEINSNSNMPFQAGDIVTVLIAIIMASVSLGGCAPALKAINESCVAASDFFELSIRVPKIDLTQSVQKPEKEHIKGRIFFNNVEFAYPSKPDLLILKGINLEFEAGKKIAVVGESGSGKSTIVNLVERLYDVTAGSILIDGINIKNFDINYLRSLIGYVQQEPVLFNCSIKDNIIFGRENITNEMIEEACEKAYANEFISKIDDKYEYIVGIKGSKLSGGQKQRIAIARAILTKPKLLILDEATSALDNTSEKEVQIALDKVSHGVTTIIVAHRLSTVQNADKIIAMRNGEIIEVGDHQTLFNKQGYYYALVKSQMNVEEEPCFDPEINIEIKNEIKIKVMSKEINDKIMNKIIKEPTKEEKEKLYKIGRAKLFDLLSDNKCSVAIAMFFSACSGAVFPAYGMLLASALQGLSSQTNNILQINGTFFAGMFLVVAGGAGISIFLQMYKFNEIGEIICQKLRSLVFVKYLRLEMGFYDVLENSPGALLTKLSSDTTMLNGIVLTMIGVSVQCFVNLVLGIVLGFVYDWRLALIGIAFLPFMVIAGSLQHSLRKGLIEADEKLDVEAGSILSESVTNTKTIFSYNMQKNVVKMYIDILSNSKKAIYSTCMFTGILFGISQFTIFVTYGTIFYAGGNFISQGTLTFGNMMKSILSIVFAAFGVGQAQQYVGDITKAKNALESLFTVLENVSNIDPLAEDQADKNLAENLKGRIEFRNVNFAYPTRPDQIVLKNLNLIIEPGQSAAFVGFSGSGKSTIVQLIERFYDVTDGQILIDDIDIKEYNLEKLRKQIGIVMQEPSLFKREVMENIRYGRLTANDEEVIQAAKDANIMKFFQGPDAGKKDTPVSGGEKQRIAIARAILKNPKILLLDEATSALDKESETEVQKSLDALMINRTTITVAHRLSTIEQCDVIYVLEAGCIVESGKFQDLLDKKGKFYALSRGKA